MLADRMRQAATPKAVAGQQAYTTAGTYTFTVPAGVTSISMVCVGGGAATGTSNSAGGTLSYVNNVSVSGGTEFTVVVGAGGVARFDLGGNSSVTNVSTSTVSCRARGGGVATPANVGTAFSGGNSDPATGGGGGGAAGYSAAGGNGEELFADGVAGTGGSGGGGAGGWADYTYYSPEEGLFYGGGGGGGVGIVGTGANGAGGVYASNSGGGGGGGGSGGSNGTAGAGLNAGNGGAFGGAGAYYGTQQNTGAEGSVGTGAGGAVRIIWGAGRSYPSNAANV